MTSALERLGAAGQGVVAKRIDLALLEGHELLSRTLGSVALIGPGVILAAIAWCAGAAACVLLIAPAATPAGHLAIFGALNGAPALGLLALGIRRSRKELDHGTGPIRRPT
jgi:hypothetical protein